MTSPKPGWATSEFWATLLTQIVALIAFFDPSLNAGQWVQPLSVVAAGLATAVYAYGRAHLKTAHVAATTTTSAAPPTTTTPPAPAPAAAPVDAAPTPGGVPAA